ncbi:hypothetical protein KSP35_09435 [Aquihabitans sp. G128]|uniref:CCC motif membrane protein n=1 Tax=Aquihabitans sp. G128 TaxID=2849779 RepID=UPI001C233324|nr:CCC motif membrane protein [Aquihabitans sp. G128]QXC62979.1 hypothetical protein KSP35_09435 [Aquihabitans sp. G128]
MSDVPPGGEWPPAGEQPGGTGQPGAEPPPAYGPPPTAGQPAGYGPPPSYGPPTYGQQPGYGYGPQPQYGYGSYTYGREHPQGTTILVLGICSLVFTFICGVGIFLGPVAWIMGNTAIKEIDANPSAYSNRGSVQTGRICGIVATALLALSVLALVVFFAFFAFSPDTSS